NSILLDSVAVWSERSVAAAEMDTRLAATPNVVVPDKVVRVAVAERHPVLAILDHVLFIEAVLGAPAEIDTLGAMFHVVASDDGTLRPGIGVNGEPDAVVQVTILYEPVVGDAPDDAVAVEIAHHDVAHDDAIALVQANGPVIERSFVEHFIIRLISVHGD